MANTLYDFGRELFLSGSLSWATAPIVMSFACNTSNSGQITASTAGTAYKANAATWGLGAATGSNQLGSASSVLTGMLWGSGNAGANDQTIYSVTAGGATATVNVIVLWGSGTYGGIVNPLVAYIDTAASGLPITPNGGNITVSWSRSGPGGIAQIFKL